MAILPSDILEALRSRLGSSAERVQLEDMTVIGHNPARILPLLCVFAESLAGPARIVQQPLWAERSEAEVDEVMCHEALVNHAFAGSDVQLLCAYDVETVDPPVLTDARQTHSDLVSLDGRFSANPSYVATSDANGRVPRALEEPCPPVEEIPVTMELRSLRQRVATSAATAQLSELQREDFVLAVNEAAINALEYGREPRIARLWCKGSSAVAEVVAHGRVDDPLVGRRCPGTDATRGRGLWLANQVCDLVQLRHEGRTTRLRLHIRAA